MKMQIKKSQKLKELKVLSVAVIALLLVLLTSLMLRMIGSGIGVEGRTTLGTLLRVIIVLVALGAVLATWLQDRYKQYTIDDDKLIISNHFLGANGNKQIVTLSPSTVSKLELQQTVLGKKYNYGSITIEIDSVSGKELHTIASIDRPQEILAAIDSHLHASRKAS